MGDVGEEHVCLKQKAVYKYEKSLRLPKTNLTQ